MRNKLYLVKKYCGVLTFWNIVQKLTYMPIFFPFDRAILF